MSFKNEPLTDFSIAANRAAFQEALARLRSSLGRKIPLLIGSQQILPHQWMPRRNPSHPNELVGLIARAESIHTDQVLAQAESAFPAWRRVPLPERAAILQRAARRLRERRFELAAWEVMEVGKNWVEADADVAEAIDYLHYYADQMLQLQDQAPLAQVPGERNLYRREPLGPGVVISPWNFPLAILTGMTAAALITGNCVILKPAEQSSIVAFHLAQILRESGVPPGALQFLSGMGKEIGEALVRSEKIRWIAFTGSREVGLKILHTASELAPTQGFVKRVIAEMGGKNAILIDQDADLDEAVLGVAASAFGYSGQKCSACSRVIALRPILERFLDRLIQTTQSLPIGNGEDPSTVIGPLVDEAAKEKVLRFIEIGKSEGRLAFQGTLPAGLQGFFVPPAIFTDVKPENKIAREEIFGPVLAVMAADSFEEALEIANNVPYALTGGLYSRSPRHIEQAAEEFRVGNLYINRKITGAVVGRQPFGGLRLSGIGYKAGGPDYLLQFLQARTITENTTRHGF